MHTHPMLHRRSDRIIPPLFAAMALAFATPAAAHPLPQTRLVSCGGGNCLMVTGHRADATSMVAIAGHAVPVAGGRSWHALVPLATVRAWSVPYARDITVRVADAEGKVEAENDASLPIGLLGHVTDLAMLTIAVR